MKTAELEQSKLVQQTTLVEEATPCSESHPNARRSLVEALEKTPDIPNELILFCVSARTNALSVGHFASVLAKHLISPEERENRNCLGKNGKLALDSVKLSQIKYLVFKYYDVAVRDQESVWKQCVVRIDEMLRRKPAKAKNIA